MRHAIHKLFALALGAVLILGSGGCDETCPPEPPGPVHFISLTKSRDFSANELKQKLQADHPLISKLIDGLPAKEIQTDAMTYRSVDPKGNSVAASGIVVYPTDAEIRGVIVAQHFTILSADEAPSSAMFLPESMFALLGYAVVATDYIGFGSTTWLTHPYLHAESTGQVTADMVLAAREYMASIGKPIMRPMYVVGYSQGGEAAVAFQKTAEEKYPEQMELTEVFAGGGPYDLTATYDQYVKTDFTAYPCSVPYISIGLDYGDRLGLDFANIFKGTLLPNYDEWFNSKQYNSTEVNERIGSTRISDFMNEDMFKPERNADIDKLYRSLSKNSLIDWKPRTKLWLFHARGDTYVPYLNSLNAYNSFKKQGCDVELVSADGDHLDQAATFYLNVLDKLK